MKNKKIVVIKVGSSLVTRDGRGLDTALIDSWIGQIAKLKKAGYAVVLVTSGAIAEGLLQLNWSERPKKVQELQAAAAVGQMGLAQTYQQLFRAHNMVTAQILLTHEDVRNRRRYLNARAALKTLLAHDVVPIINENDTVVTKEITLGDNDTLGALVVNLIEAPLYVILTDQKGLYDKNPNTHDDVNLITETGVSNPDLTKMAGGAGSDVGTGGMLTKVKAARRAAFSGATTIVAPGRLSEVLTKIILADEEIGTRFLPDILADEENVTAKEQWMLDQLIPAGTIYVDKGAAAALSSKENSLLPVGCVRVTGSFRRGDVVLIKDGKEREIARGLSNYSADEANLILGCNSEEIEEKLGYSLEDELVHRDNMTFFKPKS